MNTTVTLIGARGGSGTSTVAAALALRTADDVPTALLTQDPTAMARLLGTTGPVPTADQPFMAGPGLTVAGLDGTRQRVTIIDAGPAATVGERLPSDGRCYAVVRGPCYLALATLVSLPSLRPDGVILVAEAGRSLSSADTSAILGIPVVATVPVRRSVARLIDAGLLAGRPSEVPGLDSLAELLVRGVEPTAFFPTRRVNPPARELATNGTHQATATPWGHEL